MSLKRKLSDIGVDSAETTHPARNIPSKARIINHSGNGYLPKWRVLGDRAVPASFPLSNMLDAVRELIDPDFQPEIEDMSPKDDEVPRFLKPLPPRLAAEDIEFLRSRGAMTIPETPLRNALLSAYAQWVYSTLPMLDLHGFLDAVASNDPDANISLLLFQAVMLAGAAFVDIKHLKAAGFTTRREARKAFYNNARLLYMLDCEDDRIPIIQSILLMTYHHEKDESLQKDIWHWVGVCNTQAQSIGLHRDPTKSNMSSDVKRLRIRLWWCLYSRDRLIALALRRPTQINEGICNVPLLRLADFDIKPFSTAVNDMLFDCDHMGNGCLQHRLATIFIEKVKLCQCLGRVLFAQYAPFNCLSGSTQKTTITLVPRQASDAELHRCSQKLDSWLSNLPDEANFVIPREKKELSRGDDVLYLHSSMLQMFYHATCCALYRPQAQAQAQASAITNTPGSPEESKTVARKKIRDAASETADVAYRLRHLGLTAYLPPTGLTVMIPAAIVHMTDLKSTNPAVRSKSTWNFRLCTEVISEMRDIYPAADYESACLEMAIQKLQQGQQQQTPCLPLVIMQNDANTLHEKDHHEADHHFPNGTNFTISITEQKQRPSPYIFGESRAWDCGVNVSKKHRSLDQAGDDHPFRATRPTVDEGVVPRQLMICSNDDVDQNDDSDDYTNLLIPKLLHNSALPSLADEGIIITGDLERDLGFI